MKIAAGVLSLMRFQAPQQATLATEAEAEAVSLTAEPRDCYVCGRAAVRVEGTIVRADDPARGKFVLLAIEGKAPVIVMLEASDEVMAVRLAEFEEMLSGMRPEN